MAEIAYCFHNNYNSSSYHTLNFKTYVHELTRFTSHAYNVSVITSWAVYFEAMLSSENRGHEWTLYIVLHFTVILPSTHIYTLTSMVITTNWSFHYPIDVRYIHPDIQPLSSLPLLTNVVWWVPSTSGNLPPLSSHWRLWVVSHPAIFLGQYFLLPLSISLASFGATMFLRVDSNIGDDLFTSSAMCWFSFLRHLLQEEGPRTSQ